MSCFDSRSFEEAYKPAKIVQVSAAVLVDRDGRILLAKRPEGKSMAGLWEFPGGKVEPTETPEFAIIRELKEELDIDTSEACLAPLTFVSHRYDDFHLLMMVYICRQWRGMVRAKENQEFSWVSIKSINEYTMPDADKPILPILQELL